jgi:aminoglycoside 6-adenylyltransferase
MRSEQEMLALILDTARDDERIRAVIMNGSRTNPNAPRDIFQDFDIVYVVTDMAPFVRNRAWIERFGEMMILQLPDDMPGPPPRDGSYGYLMQFADGNRIDLTIYPLARLGAMQRDSLSVLLLDKDGIVAPFDPPSERDYLPKPPTAKAYDDCCNEFWWVSAYVAKGLWRGEIIYAKHMHDEIVRAQLMTMLTWYFGVKTGFMQSPGKLGRNFPQVLEPALWKMLLATYADADCEHTWDALFTTCALFRTVALAVAEHYGFAYPHGDDQRVSAHLERVRRLPNSAADFGQ